MSTWRGGGARSTPDRRRRRALPSPGRRLGGPRTGWSAGCSAGNCPRAGPGRRGPWDDARTPCSRSRWRARMPTPSAAGSRRPGRAVRAGARRRRRGRRGDRRRAAGHGGLAGRGCRSPSSASRATAVTSSTSRRSAGRTSRGGACCWWTTRSRAAGRSSASPTPWPGRAPRSSACSSSSTCATSRQRVERGRRAADEIGQHLPRGARARLGQRPPRPRRPRAQRRRDRESLGRGRPALGSPARGGVTGRLYPSARGSRRRDGVLTPVPAEIARSRSAPCEALQPGPAAPLRRSAG